MENVIVTGANGFIGKTLVNALLAKGCRVTALDVRFDDVLADDPRVTCISVLNKDVPALAKEIPAADYHCFFHLAWAGTSGPARADYDVQLSNVKLTCDYIKLCAEVGCKRVVYASSINEMETYEYLQSDDIDPAGGYIYGTGKLAAHLMGETVAKMTGVEFIPVIITNIYGVGEKSARMIYTAIRKLIHKEHCSFTAGYQTYDFIYITDAINAIIAGDWDKAKFRNGCIKSAVVAVALIAVYFAGYLNPDLMVVEVDGQTVNLMTAVHIALLAAFTAYAVDVLKKLKDMLSTATPGKEEDHEQQ